MNTTTKKHPFDYLKEKGLFVPMIVALAALVIGVIVGANLHGESKAEAAAPAVTVSATPAPAVTETITSVPQECLDALDEADRGFVLAADLSTEYSRAISAITSGDMSDGDNILSNIKSINSSLNNLSPRYNANKDACRATGSSS